MTKTELLRTIHGWAERLIAEIEGAKRKGLELDYVDLMVEELSQLLQLCEERHGNDQ